MGTAAVTKKVVPVSSAQSNGHSVNNPSKILIRPDDRVFIVGATGTGKTTIVQTLLARRPWVVILDPKHQFSLRSNARRTSTRGDKTEFVTSDLRKAINFDEPTPIIYRPGLLECKRGCPEFWEWIWQRENTVVYVDEVIAVSPAVNIPLAYGRCIQMGRSKNIGVWSATQRPARIPINLMSEAEHYIAFELRNPADIKRVAEFTDPVVLQDRATGHDFWYYSVRQRIPMKLNRDMMKVK
jgi:hypothetical protein